MGNYVSFPKTIQLMVSSKFQLFFAWSWATLVSSLISGKGFPPIKPTLLSFFGIMFIMISVYVYNDIVDQDLDRKNPLKKDRPIASNTVSVVNAKLMMILFSIIGLFFIYNINIKCLIISIMLFFLLLSYSNPVIHFKKRFLMNESSVFIGFILCTLVGNYSIQNVLNTQSLFSGIILGLFISYFAKPLYADTTDIEADRIFGVKTLGSVLEWNQKILLGVSIIIFMIIASGIAYLFIGFNFLVPFIMIILGVLAIKYLQPIIRHYDHEKVIKMRNFLQIYVIIIPLSMVLGSINLTVLWR